MSLEDVCTLEEQAKHWKSRAVEAEARIRELEVKVAFYRNESEERQGRIVYAKDCLRHTWLEDFEKIKAALAALAGK